MKEIKNIKLVLINFVIIDLKKWQVCVVGSAKTYLQIKI